MRGLSSHAACLATLVAGSVLAAAVPADAQERFTLTVPGAPELNSIAVQSADELVIRDAQGMEFRYERTPQLDTPDGRFLGYVSPAANQSLRWPAAGAGQMMIGDLQGLAWSPGRQQIQPAGGPVAGPRIMPAPGSRIMPVPEAGPRIVPAPAGRPPDARPPVAGALQAAPRLTSHLALGQDRAGNDLLGLIETPQIARIFRRDRDGGWRPMTEIPATNLVPGASLGLAPDVIPGQPRIYTINQRGELIQFGREQSARRLGDRIDFPAGGSLAVASADRPEGFAVDLQGRLWHLDLVNGAHEPLDESPGRFLPGSPIDIYAPGVGPAPAIYLTDSRGTILRYQRSRAGWAPPEAVADGFVPGGAVGSGVLAIPGQGTLLFVAAVDWRGELHAIQGEPQNSRSVVLASGMPPGGPVTVAVSLDGVTISGVDVEGVWRSWRLGAAGEWRPEQIAGGFPPGAPVLQDPVSYDLLAVDSRGRIAPASFEQGEWLCHFCHHSLDGSPRLVSREIIPNPPLPPARVTLFNSGAEELVVQVADAANPAASEEIQIPVRGRVERAFERDPGATVVETLLVPGPLGNLEEVVERYPLPPQPRYSLIVWANRTTYSYIDRRAERPAGAIPNFDLKSHVSVGVFELPPGELLPDGSTIDVVRAAAQRRNPGAAILLPPPNAR